MRAGSACIRPSDRACARCYSDLLRAIDLNLLDHQVIRVEILELRIAFGVSLSKSFN